MNDMLQNFAREETKSGLAKLPEDWQDKFKRMYSPGNHDLDINEVVDRMPEGKLDWAMQQVENSVRKLSA